MEMTFSRVVCWTLFPALSATLFLALPAALFSALPATLLSALPVTLRATRLRGLAGLLRLTFLPEDFLPPEGLFGFVAPRVAERAAEWAADFALWAGFFALGGVFLPRTGFAPERAVEAVLEGITGQSGSYQAIGRHLAGNWGNWGNW